MSLLNPLPISLFVTFFVNSLPFLPYDVLFEWRLVRIRMKVLIEHGRYIAIGIEIGGKNFFNTY